MLVHASETRPLMLVLDDLHWADKPTLLLLRHVLRQAKGERLLIVGVPRRQVAAHHPHVKDPLHQDVLLGRGPRT